MKRTVHLVIALALILGVMGVVSGDHRTVKAQDGPTGTWYGTWPYVLPPEHHFNAFIEGGLNTNLGALYKSFVELPAAFYMWATGEYVPLLASDWGFTEDGTAYILTLREDATWSNGDPVTADDVIATYAIGRIMLWAQFDYISTVEKVDEHTVRFVFSGEPSLLAERLILKEYIADAYTYSELAQHATEVYESGATKEDEAWTAMRTEIDEFRPAELISSGPYIYTIEDVGDSYMTLHWQPNSIFSDQVRFGELRIWAGETEVTTPLILSGDLAHSTNVYPAATQQAFMDAGIRLINIPRGYGPALLFNHTIAPWDITEVRQAVALVIEREENAFLTNGMGATGTVYMSGLADSSVPLLMNQEDIDQLDHYDYDTTRAEELMTTAGFTRNDDGKWVDADGNTISSEFKFPAEFADFSGMAQNAVEQMNAFGFDITARAVPWQQAAEDIRNSDFELSVWSWSNPSPFAARQFFAPIQRFNYVGLPEGQRGMDFPMEFEWNGETINLDQMIKDTSAGLDIEAQRELTGEVALIINQLMPYVPLNMLVSIEPFNENLIDGAPADDDPILQNPSGSGDHFIIYYLLTGVLGPK